MKKYGLPVLIVLLIGFLSFRLLMKNNKQEREPKKDPLAISANTDVFNTSFSETLEAYYSLKDAFVKSDTVSVNKASLLLAEKADSLKINEIKGDTTGTIKETARFYAGSISASVKTITAEKDLEAKRREFDAITDAVWSLTRTVRFSGGKIFYQHCPMAFNNKGAYWLSSSREILNPYFGDAMLHCGEIADSVDYSRK